MDFNNWDIIVTLLIAVYGAGLSTYTIWNERQKNKKEITVKLTKGIIKNPIGEVSSLMIFSTAMNTGCKTVTLNSMGFILPNKDRQYYTFLKPNSFDTFPNDLVEGKSCQVWISTKVLAEDLKREGYSGKVMLRGYYGDALGRKYTSKTMRFNADKAV